VVEEAAFGAFRISEIESPTSRIADYRPPMWTASSNHGNQFCSNLGFIIYLAKHFEDIPGVRGEKLTTKDTKYTKVF
jgi:hypothetical protein